MTTIRRNWTNRVAQIRAAARSCRAYDSDSGNMLPVDPARAFEAWESTPRARLTEDTPRQKWTVHVHSSKFYVLTAEETAGLATEAPVASPTTPSGPGTRDRPLDRPGLRTTARLSPSRAAGSHPAHRAVTACPPTYPPRRPISWQRPSA
ncbi:hypothetical protein ABK046_33360 [Streptomyces caeruleatus]